MVDFVDSESPRQLRRALDSYPRMHGYYLLNFVPLASGWRDEEEASLSAAFEALDDQPWPPPELRPNDQRWVDYEVDEVSARAHAVEALLGGRAVGHAMDTVPEPEALKIWEAFRGLFSPDARFFTGVGLGDSAYVFQSGVVVVDDVKAGCLCVIEND